jgi:hypothetical protein
MQPGRGPDKTVFARIWVRPRPAIGSTQSGDEDRAGLTHSVNPHSLAVSLKGRQKASRPLVSVVSRIRLDSSRHHDEAKTTHHTHHLVAARGEAIPIEVADR